jgi:hypothetical protein
MPNVDQITQFCAAVFGQGATEGDVAVCRDDDATLLSRDPDEIAEFVGDGETWVSMQTRDSDKKPWEQPAVAEALDSADVSPPPSMLLKHVAGDLFGIWFIDTAKAGEVPRELQIAAPLPGVGGWSIAEMHDDRVYTLEALQASRDPADEPVQHKDALIFGTLDQEMMQRPIEVALNISANVKSGTWRNVKMTVGGLIDSLAKHEVGDKDGKCFLQGAVIDGERRANAIPHMDLLVLDLDTGESMEAVKARLIELGLFGVIYTTHSNLKPVTEIKKDAVIRWLGGTTEPDVDQVKAYLTDVKRYQPAVLEGATLLPTEHTADGIMLKVQHKPMPKFRVLLLLEKRFVIAERAPTQQGAIAEWKERYAGASKLLGAFFDRACVDPSRLFYTPRHPKTATDFAVWVIAGKPLDIDTCDRLTAEEVKREAMGAFERAAASFSGDKEYKTTSMKFFAGKYGMLFDAETFLLEMDGDGDRGSRTSGPGRAHRCPNDDQHSNAGDADDRGFFCINGTDNDERGFAMHCTHDACMNLDRLDHLDLACQRAGIADATELTRWCAELVEEEAPAKSEEAPQTPDSRAYSNVAEAKRAISALAQGDGEGGGQIARNIGMSGFDSAARDVLKDLLSKKSTLAKRTINDEFKAGRAASIDEAKPTSQYPMDTLKQLAAMNKRYAVLKLGGKVRILEEPEGAGGEIDTMEPTSFNIFLANQTALVIDENNTPALRPIADVWTKWPDRRTYKKAIMEPYAPGASNPAKANEYNFWTGYVTKPRTGDWGLLRGHVFENICHSNDEWFHWFMTWCAQLLQQPGLKMGSSVGICGTRGSGKSKFFDWMQKLIGDCHAKKVNSPHYITGHFNAIQIGLILLVCEEAVWAGDARATSVLKDLITSETMMVERKGIDAIPTRNAMRLAMISNERWIAPVSFEHERRFFVLETLNGNLQNIDFFKDVDFQMEHGGAEAMMRELLEWKPAGNNWNILRKPIVTPWLRQQARESLEPWDNFFVQMVTDGGCKALRGNDDTPPIELSMEDETLIPLDLLRHYYSSHLSRHAAGKYKVGNDGLMVDGAVRWLLADGTLYAPDKFDEDRSSKVKVPPLKEIMAEMKKRGGMAFDVISQPDIDPLRPATT